MRTGFLRFEKSAVRALVCVGAALLLPSWLAADPGRKNPASKFYVADIDGEAEIDTGDKIDELNKKSVYNAEGTVVETKANAANAMVFSNGTGIFFESDTRVEMKRFQQEPFLPNRTDMETEPSVSQTQAYLSRGTIGLCTSRLVAGSNMVYETPLGSVNIRGGRVVIQSTPEKTVVTVIEGESTVLAGNVNMGGFPLRNGQQAIITAGAAGQNPTVVIQPIPPDKRAQLEAKVTMACTAKKTVYFETRVRAQSRADGASAEAAGGLSLFSSSASSSGSDFSLTGGSVTAFDDTPANATPPTTPNSNASTVIVAIPVVPANLPVQNDASPNVL